MYKGKEVVYMANTATVYARIEPKLKDEVDKILNDLGVTPSSLIQMLYSQIKLTKSIPFEVKLPRNSILIDELTKDEFNYELLKGINDIEKGNVKTIDEVDEILKKKLGS